MASFLFNSCQYFTLQSYKDWLSENDKAKNHIEFDSIFGGAMLVPNGVVFDSAENIYVLNGTSAKFVEKYD
jgi:hypothetical protein